MAAVKEKNKSSARKRTSSTGKTSSTGRKNNGRKSVHKGKRKDPVKDMYRDEIILVASLVISLLLILSNFNLSGKVGNWINGFTFGMFGFLAYLLPFFLFFSVAFGVANRGSWAAHVKITSAVLMSAVLAAIIQLFNGGYAKGVKLTDIYQASSKERIGGGFIGGLLLSLLSPLFGTAGSYVVLCGIMIVLIVVFTGKSLLKPLGKKSEEALQQMKEMKRLRQEEAEQEVPEEEAVVPKRKARIISFPKNEKESTEGENTAEEAKADEIPSMKKGKSARKKKEAENKAAVEMQEIIPATEEEIPIQQADMGFILHEEAKAEEPAFMEEDNIPDITSAGSFAEEGFFNSYAEEVEEEKADSPIELQQETEEAFPEAEQPVEPQREPAGKEKAGEAEADLTGLSDEMSRNQQVPVKEYIFPPLDLLAKPKGNARGMSERDLKETAMKLQKTLESFGVGVSVTNVSCGPSVTRYELLPEQGVKVSRITGLADDIKLNLAAADIRIEAPIPGKAAVGIEVPNKDNSMVLFRELIDSREFKEHSSDIAFAVGKDIGGQIVVTDIAKMPHLLIAGATGSGKSVCINTLIMSILYKANPSDVKMIMVDPKVVELSVYNGIPHLLIPVVTDPKKASAALNWAVMEMTERYKKFADLGVRDVKGYNEKVATVAEYQDERYQKLPQIVIIVDELADLMMVAPGEVEDAICRLAQMARAAGLHLIIATQRPSVNVITGLIKANIPSRIAFSVSSAIDSRTIIDGAGAEKLLGKGDMLFFPSGYPKPIRVQGAFISDKEVSGVVKFLSETNSGAEYNEEVAGKIANAQITDSSGAAGGSERDDYFVEAGKFIIDKDKASIGMLQRVYKIGFNRAARIMDQLAEAGVVGPEEGTKPRKILMSLEEFEEYVDEYL